MRRYLYSLIGYDDPTSEIDSHLGSILTILKSETFDKLFLYRSYEISSLSNYKLKETKLKEIIKEVYNIPVVIASLPKEDSNIVGNWKDIFASSLQSAISEDESDDILWYVNFSVGTPIMVSALTHAILTINRPIFAVYANKPLPKQSKKYEITKKQIITMMDTNDTEVSIASIKQLQDSEIKAQINQLIDSHDYHGASLILQNMKSTYYETLKNMCDGADALTKLELQKARECFTFTPLLHILKKQIPQDIYKLVVYVNNLEIKSTDNEYFDFVMRTSPLLYQLCMLILTDYTHFPKQAIAHSEKYSTEVIPKRALSIIPTEFKKYFEGYFKKNSNADCVVITTPLMVHLIQYQLTSSMSIYNELNELRSFEEKIRNEFAHVFSEYSDEYIYSKTGKHPHEVLELYKKVIKKIAYQHVNDDSLFELYQDINQTIKDYVDVSE